MAETAPWLLQECFTATGARLFTGNIVCGEGVANVAGGWLLVTTGGSGLTLSVAEGGGFVDSDTDDEGMYSIFNDAPVTLTATTADGTNPRIDQVIATVNDAQLSGSDNDWVLSVLAGTPTVGATLSNLNGAAALPDRSIRLAYVLVPAAFAGPFVNATHILDARDSYTLCSSDVVNTNDWVVLVAAAGWTANTGDSAPQVKRVGNTIYWKGGLFGGAGVATTVPVWARPINEARVPVIDATPANSRVRVLTDGTVEPTTNIHAEAQFSWVVD